MVLDVCLDRSKSHTYFSPVEKVIESITIYSLDLLPPVVEEEEEDDDWCDEDENFDEESNE